MQEIVQYVIEGFPVGCVYGLVAVGLVLTYKTSGVFNLAFGAQAFLSAAVYFQIVERGGHPRWLGFLVAVVIVGPLVGFVLDHGLFRHMRGKSWQVKLVSALGLLVAMPEIVKAFFGQQPEFAPPSMAPLLGISEDRVFQVDQYYVSADRVAAVLVTLAVVLALVLLFRYSAIGLQMRAVVESPRMVELAGVDADRVSTVAWMMSSFLAGLAGVLLAPLFATLDANNYTLLIVAAIAAAAFGRLSGIPLALAGGLVLGIGQRVISGKLPADSILAQGIRPSLPFLLLLGLLLLWPGLRDRREVADPLAGVDPPPPAMAHEYKTPELVRATRILFFVFIGAFVLLNLFVVSDLWVFRFTDGLTLTVAFLSITIFTGLGGQISLGQATFAGFGGYATAQLMTEHGVAMIPALLIGALLAAVVGVVLAVPALRLGGIFLTLATLAFALMADNIIFVQKGVSGGQEGVEVLRPGWVSSDQAWFLFVFGVFAVVGFVVVLIRRGTTGQFLAAIRGSETAAASIGINATRLRITLFALSSAIAGLGGGLIALHAQKVDPLSFPALLGAAWVVLVVTLGARTVDGAVNAGMGFVISQWLFADALNLEASYVLILFGLGAITYARHPEGIVEYRTRVSIQATIKNRMLNARAGALRAAGRLPSQWLPVRVAVLPVALGPLLYTVWIVGVSLLTGDWRAVHTWPLVAFLVPSLLWAAGWVLRSDAELRRAGGLASARFALLGGGAAGALFGWWLADGGNVPWTTSRAVLAGIPAGFFAVAFFALPLHVERVAQALRWPESPITWHEGRVPFGFLAAAVFLLYRTTTPTPPAGWPLYAVGVVTTIVWLQWIGAVQGAANELWIGPVGEPADEARPLEPAVPVPAHPAPAPAGGAA